MYIFVIPRVHRLMLCIWFPRYMACLTPQRVQAHRGSFVRLAGECITLPGPLPKRE